MTEEYRLLKRVEKELEVHCNQLLSTHDFWEEYSDNEIDMLNSFTTSLIVYKQEE